ncbi:MAG: transposase, partial [Planctomycetota bacterium]|nr:transposase [Planctomycetota bacterium]
MSKQRRRRYDSEFKRRAVEFVLAGEKSVPQIATDLGIELSSLYRWKREYLVGHDEATPDVSATATELDEELRPLLIKLENPLATGNQVRVDLAAVAGGPITVGLRYQVFGAGWWPAYNARLEESSAQVTLEYYGIVSQTTG